MKTESKKIWMNILKNILNVVVIVMIALIASIASNIFTSLLENHFYLSTIVSTVVYLGIILLLGSLYAKKVLKMNLSEIGLSFSSVKKMGTKGLFWIFFALLIPCLVLSIYFVFIPGRFLIDENARISQNLFFGIIRVGLWAGIGEEFLFRGLLFRYMKKTLGTVAAVLIPSIVFGLLHIMNMTEFNFIDMVLIALGGTSVAILFTLMVIKTDSLLPGMLLHSCWNTLIIGSIFGIGDIVNGFENNAIIQYRLASSNHLLTGGNFGIEVALPAVAVYLVACVFVFGLIKKAKM